MGPLAQILSQFLGVGSRKKADRKNLLKTIIPFSWPGKDLVIKFVVQGVSKPFCGTRKTLVLHNLRQTYHCISTGCHFSLTLQRRTLRCISMCKSMISTNGEYLYSVLIPFSRCSLTVKLLCIFFQVEKLTLKPHQSDD